MVAENAMKGRHYKNCILCGKKRALPGHKESVCRACSEKPDIKVRMENYRKNI